MVTSVGSKVPILRQIDWSQQPRDTYITEIEALRLPVETQPIAAGSVVVQQASSAQWWVSSGFSISSGLIMLSGGRRFTLAHIQPGNDAFFRHLDKIGKQRQRRKLVIISGSESSPQSKLAELAAEEYWGPIEVSTVDVESGRIHWGLAFDTKTGLIRIVRKTPRQTILDYRPRW